MGKRGGTRANAGRKLDPVPMVRISIGAECERQFNGLAEETAWAFYRARKRKTLVPVIQAITKLKRQKAAMNGDVLSELLGDPSSSVDKGGHLTPHAQRLLRKHGSAGLTKGRDELLDDEVMAIKKALPKKMQSGQGSFKSAVSIPLRRPKGARALILHLVAIKFGVAQSVVNKCWKEYRMFLEGNATPYRRKTRPTSRRV